MDLPTAQEAVVSVGSNLGDKRRNCLAAIARLAAVKQVEIVKQAGLFATQPVDYKDQDWFVNTAVLIETRLSPVDLLGILQDIEQQAGRKRTPHDIRFGPRVLDLDIVLYGNRVIETRDLVIPHPRMHKRCFVLQPICDMEPDIIHPVLGKTARELLMGLDDTQQQVVRIS